MRVRVLIADDDMDAHQLMCDVLEIIFKKVKIERALSWQSFWAKVAAGIDDASWHLIFLPVEYIREEQENFIERLAEVNSDTSGKIIIVGSKEELQGYDEYVRALPFLAKPFSLDDFEEIVKAVHAA